MEVAVVEGCWKSDVPEKQKNRVMLSKCKAADFGFLPDSIFSLSALL
ncbi:hypothetical protein CHCC20335_3432 [Bacillus paralicheniformis]|nr:hypothetical protein CHCC20335_3432 [Bacillus paralicheniformis]